jgi:hypothetical protein
MGLESTQPLSEKSTGNLPGGKGQPAHKDDNLTAIHEQMPRKCQSVNVLSSYGPLGLLQSQLYLSYHKL